MGTHTLENSKSKKYLGDQIHEDLTAVSISETLNNEIPLAKKKCTEILRICNDPRLVGFNIATGPIEQFKSRIASKLLNNADSWIGLKECHRLQKVRDDFSFGQRQSKVHVVVG